MTTEAYLKLRPRLRQVAQIDTFTLAFRNGAMAVLDVYNAPSFLAALAVAQDALPRCAYTVTPGDQTNGWSAVFYAWGYQGKDAQGQSADEKEAAL